MKNSVGRFAPSPSGLLHFGSFITALGSYLQAKSAQGHWLVRIEDLDPPREVSGAAADILFTLEKLGLYWDGEVVYQSTRLARYQDILHSLIQDKGAYYCDCSRQRVQNLASHVYDNHCQNRHLTASHQRAIRFKQTYVIDRFIDNIRQCQRISVPKQHEDFIIRRKDGLFAYNFAVVIDDHEQGVTEVVRGADLLSVTTKQMSLYLQLGWSLPSYYHLPLVLNQNRDKLSKQNHAPPIKLDNITQLLIKGLVFLGQPIPHDWQDGSKEQLLQWAINHWNAVRVPQKDSIIPDLTANI
ncbi:glutamyl-Q tRNA(Asp) synthetase [Orbus hercynius]|uniref:Glutamyl-Q tRNA(Asp) synthetase n=1 Tax=Orbus hercynius TaxID=593135 RepID=A0A495REY0_9GAMM|nr:tRNA glutamyl-Q(34) synthetase GluQRS [Orbus hercynius]RKS86053.1 glutamyl-Q tRNA(Asp) synthetase [Orbus hercynius]